MRTDKRVHTDVFNVIKQHTVKLFRIPTKHKWEDYYKGYSEKLVRFAKVGHCLCIYTERLSYSGLLNITDYKPITDTEALLANVENFLHFSQCEMESPPTSWHINQSGYIDTLKQMLEKLAEIPEVEKAKLFYDRDLPTIGIWAVTEFGVNMSYTIIINNQGMVSTPRSMRDTNEWKAA